MTDIEVTVVICALNEERRIGRQLAALDAQVDAPAFEVVVVDNGSTDRTADVVREWIANDGHASVDARLVDGSAPPGIPGARNAGARAAAGRLLAYCDADDEVQPGWVAALARGATGDVLAGGRIIAFAPDGSRTGDLYGQGLIATSYLPHIGGACFAISRFAYFAVGGFDESLPRYGFDDVDFSWRVQEAGYPITYIDDAEVRFSLSGAGASVKKRFQLGKGRVLMARRFPLYDSTTYTVRSTLADAAKAAARALRASAAQRSPDKAQISRAVAAAGRVAGALAYRGGSTPPRKLLREDEDAGE